MRLFAMPYYQALQGDGGAEPALAAVSDEPNADALDTSTDEPDPKAEPAKPQQLPDGVISTITGLRAKAREAEERATRAEQRAADAQALADRISKGGGTEPAPQVTQRSSTSDDDAAVNARAEYLLYRRDAAAVGERLGKEFGQQRLNDAVNLLGAATSDNGDDMLRSIMAVDKDNAHLLLNALSQNPERIISLANMDPARRISELTRMSIAASTPAPAKAEPALASAAPVKAAPAKQVSKAPAPAPAVDPSASRDIDWRTDPNLSDEEWSKSWNASRAARAATRHA